MMRCADALKEVWEWPPVLSVSSEPVWDTGRILDRSAGGGEPALTFSLYGHGQTG